MDNLQISRCFSHFDFVVFYQPYLPYGARLSRVNGTTYYEAGGMWFLPVAEGYMMVERPIARAQITIPVPSLRFYASFN